MNATISQFCILCNYEYKININNYILFKLKKEKMMKNLGHQKIHSIQINLNIQFIT